MYTFHHKLDLAYFSTVNVVLKYILLYELKRISSIKGRLTLKLAPLLRNLVPAYLLERLAMRVRRTGEP